MWKNIENRVVIILSLVIAAMEFVLFKDSGLPVWKFCVLLAAPLAVLVMFLVTAAYRYRKIRSYTEYVNRIQNGEYTLPLEENSEGELSILQNEVYKVTKRLTEQAELLNGQKEFLSDSISNISHQLKTPVTSLLMMADLLQQPGLPEEKRKEFTENITLGLERMQWLVQGLLMLAKLDSGTIEMKKDMVRVSELIQESLRHVRILAEEKDVSIAVQGEDSITYTGDQGWSIEACTNIIKNCIEHTQSGGVVRITYEFNMLATVITIEDNGEGIDNDDLHHIFERFYKGKNASSNSVGIGLALAKEIVIRQQGIINVESEVGKGTRFYLKFYKQ